MLLKGGLNKCFFKNETLKYDEACMDIINKLNDTVAVLGQYNECHKCRYMELASLEPNSNTSILINTIYPVDIYYYKNNDTNATFCRFDTLLYEHYHYGWNISEKCNQIYIKEPADNAYLPILMAFVVLFCFGTLWYMVKCIYKHSGRLRSLINFNALVEEELGSTSTSVLVERKPSIRKHPNRIKSLDIFRGLSIVLMIFVNYGGGQFWFFKHSVWNGITVADLVFPWFLWIMGFSLTISLHSKLRKAVPRRQIVFHIILRSFQMILLGVIINSNQNLSTIAKLRFPGVLQRCGITYLIVGLLEVSFTKRIELENISWYYDVLIAWPQYIVVASLLLLHTCLTFFVNVPHCGAGYLGPGGLDDGGAYQNCTGGFAGYLDRAVFGQHMYEHPRCRVVYENKENYDPEGLLGTLTATFIVYLGVQAGRTLKTYQNVSSKVKRWVIWGIVMGLLGGALCEFRKNDGLIPINKQLWSLSYVLVTAGMAFIIETFLYLIVDIYRKWGGRPLFYPGMNAIFLYVGHEFLRNTFPFAWIPVNESHATYLFMNLWGTALWVSISIYLYKHNIFFKL